MALKNIIKKEFNRWVDDNEQSDLWEPCDVKDFAQSIAYKVIAQCCLIAEFTQIDDEQSYYGKLFADHIRSHFEIE